MPPFPNRIAHTPREVRDFIRWKTCCCCSFTTSQLRATRAVRSYDGRLARGFSRTGVRVGKQDINMAPVTRSTTTSQSPQKQEGTRGRQSSTSSSSTLPSSSRKSASEKSKAAKATIGSHSHSAMAASTASSSLKSSKPTLCIIGSGWAGWTLAQELSQAASPRYRTILISPARTMALTPLLASAACSIFDFRLAEEPVRRRGAAFEKYQALVAGVDFAQRRLSCRAVIGGSGVTGESQTSGRAEDDGQEFDVAWDKLVIAPGMEVNTFGTKGVPENCLFMKTVPDARKLREGILDAFEKASLPSLSPAQRVATLHFVIVGGGPTGVELAAEIDDLIQHHLVHVYPHLKGMPRISVYDVAHQILGSFDKHLSEYARKSFEERQEVSIRTGKHITEVGAGWMDVKEEGRVDFGMCVWAVGNKNCKLVEELRVRKSEGLVRVLTDKYLRVLAEEGAKEEVLDGVYALGDCADIDGAGLPTTAEVAVQKAKYLAKTLLEDAGEDARRPFEYEPKAGVAYLGMQDGVVMGKDEDWTGARAWLAWRSGSMMWTRGWRRRVMMAVNWVANWVDGREIARR